MKIEITTISHDQQRYNTCGDWQFEGEPFGEERTLSIRVSDMGDARYEFLVGIHEAIEAFLAVNRLGPDVEKALDIFDMNYEKERKTEDESEPGDSSDCPVYLEHQIATGIERILAAHLNVDWKTYDGAVTGL